RLRVVEDAVAARENNPRRPALEGGCNERERVQTGPPGGYVIYRRITWRPPPAFQTLKPRRIERMLFQSFDDDATSAAPNQIAAPGDAQFSGLDKWLQATGPLKDSTR